MRKKNQGEPLIIIASVLACDRFKLLLSWYGSASGQSVNFENSAVCFSPNVSKVNKTGMTTSLGIPLVAGFSVLSPNLLRTGSTVDLLQSNFGSWDADLIHGLFSPNEAFAILSIHWPSAPSSDKLIWSHDSFGFYSVKSDQISNKRSKYEKKLSYEHITIEKD
ncbi:hypothetical protein F8388_009810 [Cannabis sativa]|uniref:Uncharacterized protein n=1 Tax=Cannabis sativa TaxID=3483 RepID=A0A7J6H384_CANSA|nr:hypothetical protein F8388_009810 [Cannabis sativa]